MPISFDLIPDDLRTPGQRFEVDNRRAVQSTTAMKKALLIVQRLATGSAAALVPTPITRKLAAEDAFGRGSIGSDMCQAFIDANPHTELWAIALDDEAAGTKGTKTLTFTGPATGDGNIHLYVAGRKVATVPVADEDTADEIATAVEAAFDLITDLPFVASVATNVVTATAQHKGTLGNQIVIEFNRSANEVLPPGVGLAIATGVTGVTDPDVADAIAVMGDELWDHVGSPYNDATSLDTLAAEMLDRWSPLVQRRGHAFSAAPGSLGAHSTLGNALNGSFLSVLGMGASPSLPWVIAAQLTAIDAAEPHPARPRTSIAIPDMVPPKAGATFTAGERNTLLFDGISTYTVGEDGTCRIERLITTYQLNALGQPDDSWLDRTTPSTLKEVIRRCDARIAAKYGRHMLADDGTQFAPGQPVVTPSIIRDELITLFIEMERDALVEDFAQFKTDLLVERDPANPVRINVRFPPNIINGFLQLAAQVQFIL